MPQNLINKEEEKSPLISAHDFFIDHYVQDNLEKLGQDDDDDEQNLVEKEESSEESSDKELSLQNRIQERLDDIAEKFGSLTPQPKPRYSTQNHNNSSSPEQFEQTATTTTGIFSEEDKTTEPEPRTSRSSSSVNSNNQEQIISNNPYDNCSESENHRKCSYSSSAYDQKIEQLDLQE